MAIVAIFSAAYCNADEVAARTADRLGYSHLTDDMLVAAASETFGAPSEKLQKALHGSPGFFNKLTREKEKYVAFLRATAVELIAPDNLVYHGFGALLLPNTLTHVLRVCLAATHEYRIQQAQKANVPRKEAKVRIDENDEACADWTAFLFELGPWDKSLYDTFLAMQSVSVDAAVNTLCEYARQPAVKTTAEVQNALTDSLLAAKVNMALVAKGYDTDVSCREGHVTILIRKHTLRMQRLQDKLEAIARGVSGVQNATARPGPRCREPSVYAPLDVDVPSKVLLVDDEKEFVHTLSERLQTRRMQPAIAYDGEEALSLIKADQPDVMVLDLKMPGIDGLEVLRRVKQQHPDTEVIILTGHGSDAEEVLAAQLGAFAYLRKPVDIDILTDTMKRAYRKVNTARNGSEHLSQNGG